MLYLRFIFFFLSLHLAFFFLHYFFLVLPPFFFCQAAFFLFLLSDFFYVLFFLSFTFSFSLLLFLSFPVFSFFSFGYSFGFFLSFFLFSFSLIHFYCCPWVFLVKPSFFLSVRRLFKNFRHNIFFGCLHKSSDAIHVAFLLSFVYLKTQLHTLFWNPQTNRPVNGQHVTVGELLVLLGRFWVSYLTKFFSSYLVNLSSSFVCEKFLENWEWKEKIRIFLHKKFIFGVHDYFVVRKIFLNQM